MSDSKHRDALRLAAETGCDPRTARKWLDRRRVYRSIAEALLQAAKQLGIERPELQQEAS